MRPERYAAGMDGSEALAQKLGPILPHWNERHRLFAPISLSWRGRPLVSHELIVELIGATATRAGLTVQAVRGTGGYPTKIKVCDEEPAAAHLAPHAFHGEWNHTISPAAAAYVFSSFRHKP